MRCFIAIDSGGTKTDAVLFEETGHILARSLTQGCNAMDIGIGSACESLLGVLQNLVARIPGDGTLVSIYSGVAATDYFGGELGRYIRPYFPDVTMRFEDDAVNLISGTLGHQDGCCIISGTGSSLYARIGERIVHLGGWGYLIDTGGSGYAIGRDAILAVFRYCDGRAPYTRLYDLIQEQMGMPPEKNIPGIYEGGKAIHRIFRPHGISGAKGGRCCGGGNFPKGRTCSGGAYICGGEAVWRPLPGSSGRRNFCRISGICRGVEGAGIAYGHPNPGHSTANSGWCD